MASQAQEKMKLHQRTSSGDSKRSLVGYLACHVMIDYRHGYSPSQTTVTSNETNSDI